jgi:hypothetical protein
LGPKSQLTRTSTSFAFIIRVIRKEKHGSTRTLEFDHTQGENKKQPAKKYISIQGGMKLRKP